MKRLFRRIYRMFNPRKRYYNKVTFKDIDVIYTNIHRIQEDVRSLAHSVKRQKVRLPSNFQTPMIKDVALNKPSFTIANPNLNVLKNSTTNKSSSNIIVNKKPFITLSLI